MKKVLLFVMLAIFLTACSSSKKSARNSQTTTSQSGDFIKNSDANDGSSYEKAIVIEEKTEKPGVDAEYVWLRKNYPGCSVNKQSLRYNNGKPYDVLSITTADGKKKDIYFDISNFFGKF